MRTYPCDSVRSGWSAILKARTLIQISWPNETERAFSEEAPSTTIRPVAETVKLKQKYLFQRRDYWTSRSLISRKTSYLRGVLKESVGN